MRTAWATFIILIVLGCSFAINQMLTAPDAPSDATHPDRADLWDTPGATAEYAETNRSSNEK